MKYFVLTALSSCMLMLLPGCCSSGDAKADGMNSDPAKADVTNGDAYYKNGMNCKCTVDTPAPGCKCAETKVRCSDGCVCVPAAAETGDSAEDTKKAPIFFDRDTEPLPHAQDFELFAPDKK